MNILAIRPKLSVRSEYEMCNYFNFDVLKIGRQKIPSLIDHGPRKSRKGGRERAVTRKKSEKKKERNRLKNRPCTNVDRVTTNGNDVKVFPLKFR